MGIDGLDHVQVAARASVEWDDRIPGRRRFFTSDPWGNPIELLAP